MYELAKCYTYGKRGLVTRLLGFLARLNRKGYISILIGQEIVKDLKKRGMTI